MCKDESGLSSLLIVCFSITNPMIQYFAVRISSVSKWLRKLFFVNKINIHIKSLLMSLLRAMIIPPEYFLNCYDVVSNLNFFDLPCYEASYIVCLVQLPDIYIPWGSQNFRWELISFYVVLWILHWKRESYFPIFIYKLKVVYLFRTSQHMYAQSQFGYIPSIVVLQNIICNFKEWKGVCFVFYVRRATNGRAI